MARPFTSSTIVQITNVCPELAYQIEELQLHLHLVDAPFIDIYAQLMNQARRRAYREADELHDQTLYRYLVKKYFNRLVSQHEKIMRALDRQPYTSCIQKCNIRITW